jgi:PAS domain S-box-containing protein
MAVASLSPEPVAPASILIVEDEGIIAGHIAARLTKSGYKVAGLADSSEEAAARIAELQPDLVLMDVHIKGAKDGIETVAELRAYSDIPVIYLTAHMDETTINRAKLTRASGFLAKPVHHAILASSIEMAIYKYRADAQVRRQSAWISTILSTMASAIVVIDSAGKVQFLNGLAEELTGWTHEEAAERDLAEVLPVKDPRTGESANHLLAPPDGPRQPSYLPRGLVAVTRSGALFPVEGEMAASIGSRSVVGVVLTFRDATARKSQEEEIRHRSKMEAVGRLAGGIAHDFNNLLLLILGYTNELIRASAKTDHALRALNEIRKAGEMAARITEQLLRFSRSEPIEKEDLDINESIRDSEDILRRLAGSGVSFDLRLEKKLARVRADRGYLKQILLNLVVNARDAMPEGGRITIETANIRLPQGFVELTVTDTGHGMTPEVAERLFEPFFTTKPLGKGTGLGLAIVHSVVADLGGTIQVASEPEKGASFTIRIPAVPATDEPAVREPSTEPVEADKPAVLLVEDDVLVRQLLKSYLEDFECRLLIAENGREAIRIMNELSEPLGVLVTDVAMHGANGFEVANAASARFPGLRILFISGTALRFDDERAALPAGSRFLAKPFIRSEILGELKRLLTADGSSSEAPDVRFREPL